MISVPSFQLEMPVSCALRGVSTGVMGHIQRRAGEGGAGGREEEGKETERDQ